MKIKYNRRAHPPPKYSTIIPVPVYSIITNYGYSHNPGRKVFLIKPSLQLSESCAISFLGRASLLDKPRWIWTFTAVFKIENLDDCFYFLEFCEGEKKAKMRRMQQILRQYVVVFHHTSGSYHFIHALHHCNTIMTALHVVTLIKKPSVGGWRFKIYARTNLRF